MYVFFVFNEDGRSHLCMEFSLTESFPPMLRLQKPQSYTYTPHAHPSIAMLELESRCSLNHVPNGRYLMPHSQSQLEPASSSLWTFWILYTTSLAITLNPDNGKITYLQRSSSSSAPLSLSVSPALNAPIDPPHIHPMSRAPRQSFYTPFVDP